MTTDVPPVIVTVPAELGPVEVLIRHEQWGVEASVRPVSSGLAWQPLHHLGGTIREVQP
jgi:hypothetical protein